MFANDPLDERGDPNLKPERGKVANAASFPVYRAVANDSHQTRYYLDPVSGDILKKVDGSAQAYRWLHEGLHRLDFTEALRSRPVWDALILVLITGVTLICISGCYFGALRVTGRRRTPRR